MPGGGFPWSQPRPRPSCEMASLELPPPVAQPRALKGNRYRKGFHHGHSHAPGRDPVTPVGPAQAHHFQDLRHQSFRPRQDLGRGCSKRWFPGQIERSNGDGTQEDAARPVSCTTNEEKKWWAGRDSNSRLPPCEDGTLTAELPARFVGSYTSARDSMQPQTPKIEHPADQAGGPDSNCRVRNRR